jgi:hypothetical protein
MPYVLTRRQVARRLGRSIATVRKLEGRRLWPRLDGAGIHRFDEDEVDALARDVQQTGRALPFALESAARTSPRTAPHREKMGTSEQALRDADACHKRWKERVADACAELVETITTTDTATLDALDALLAIVDE